MGKSLFRLSRPFNSCECHTHHTPHMISLWCLAWYFFIFIFSGLSSPTQSDVGCTTPVISGEFLFFFFFFKVPSQISSGTRERVQRHRLTLHASWFAQISSLRSGSFILPTSNGQGFQSILKITADPITSRLPLQKKGERDTRARRATLKKIREEDREETTSCKRGLLLKRLA